MTPSLEQQKERLAVWEIASFYKHWQKRKWKHRQAADALRDLTRRVVYWVGTERAKELLP